MVYTDANGVIYNIKRSSNLSVEEEIKLFGREDLAGELKEMFIGKELILEPSGAGTTKYEPEFEKPTYVEGSFAAILASYCEPPAHLKEWLESSF